MTEPTKVDSIDADLSSIKMDIAVTRERVDQLDKRFGTVNTQFMIYSSIIAILLAIMGWGIFSLQRDVNGHTAAIAHLEGVVKERSRQQAQKIDNLRDQVSVLTEGFAEAPSILTNAAAKVNRTADEFVEQVGKLNQELLGVQDAAAQWEADLSYGMDPKKLEDLLTSELGTIRRLVEELRNPQDQR